MKIICKEIQMDSGKLSTIKGSSNGNLTVGKEYIVLVVYYDNPHGLGFQIECDEGDLMIPSANRFDLVSNYLPSNWEIIFKPISEGSHYFQLAPRAWNKARFEGETADAYRPNFYEAIIDVNTPLEGLEGWRKYPPEQIPEVVKVYFQEKDIIYQEEAAYEKANASGFSKPSSILLNLIKNGNSST